MKNIWIGLKLWLKLNHKIQVHNGCFSCNGYGKKLITNEEDEIIEVDCDSCFKIFMEKIR